MMRFAQAFAPLALKINEKAGVEQKTLHAHGESGAWSACWACSSPLEHSLIRGRHIGEYRQQPGTGLRFRLPSGPMNDLGKGICRVTARRHQALVRLQINGDGFDGYAQCIHAAERSGKRGSESRSAPKTIQESAYTLRTGIELAAPAGRRALPDGSAKGPREAAFETAAPGYRTSSTPRMMAAWPGKVQRYG